MKLFSFFKKRRYPYAPIAFLGRKNVEKMLGADIQKLKKIDKMNQAKEELSANISDEINTPTTVPELSTDTTPEKKKTKKKAKNKNKNKNKTKNKIKLKIKKKSKKE